MMIEYRSIHDFEKSEPERFFLSVEWSSGHYPDKLVAAMKNLSTVISAWDNGQLVGMICAKDDGIMNVYVHYLLVDPDFHGKRIGRKLAEMVRKKYNEYMRIAAIAYNDKLSFYENCRFKGSNDLSPVFITSLWT